MTINWFPGHMTKAIREISEALKQVDMVIEIRDARIAGASANPLFENLLINKKRLIILSKADLADNRVTKQWIEYLSSDDKIVLAFDLYKLDLKLLVKKCQELMKEKRERQIRKGIKAGAISVLVVGIPNVGKSTLINQLVKRKSLTVADKPGVTRALKWVKINDDLSLLDSPGVLWPKLDDEENALFLAVTGAISDKVLDLEKVGKFAYLHLYTNYRDKLFDRYGDLPEDFHQALLTIGKKRQFLKKNGEIDEERALITFVDEIRSSKFQGVSWQFYHG